MPYINYHEAVERLKGSEKLYLSLLRGYRGASQVTDLIKQIEAGERKEALILSKSLRGTAANLALNDFYRVISRTDKLLRNDCIEKDNIKELKKSIAKTTEMIQGLLARQ